MSTVALIGAQWGDEGKGKTIDILAQQAEMVVRAQGGSNAGHTVVYNGQEYKLRLIPSGILYEDTDCIIGCGCVVHPGVVLKEIESLTARGVKMDKLRIDARANVIMPYHIAIDTLAEQSRGKNDIGTTKNGIGPCYMDKDERVGIRMRDLIDEKLFAEKLKNVLKVKNDIIVKLYGGKALDFDEIYNEYAAYAKKLAPFVCDTTVLVYNAIKSGKKVLFEGAQGTLLDIDLGTYPFVTSSHPTAGGFCIGAGVGPTLIDEVIGVAKSYITRVGKGPFPTELFDEVGDTIRNRGHEFGTVTGRPRRCGWFDTLILKFAVRVNGLTGVAINKLDTLSGLKTVKVCTAYEKDGEILHDFPADIADLEGCKPIYTELPGWDDDLSDCKKFEDLPENARNYILYLEKEIGCPIKMIGVGPDRNQNINR
jgi:adenylosuccinate synthase